MAEYLIQDTTLTEIADAIRGKISDTAKIDAADMAEKIESIDVEEYIVEVTVDSGANINKPVVIFGGLKKTFQIFRCLRMKLLICQRNSIQALFCSSI